MNSLCLKVTPSPIIGLIEGARLMIENEERGGPGWWEGFEKLRHSYQMYRALQQPDPVAIEKATKEATEEAARRAGLYSQF